MQNLMRLPPCTENVREQYQVVVKLLEYHTLMATYITFLGQIMFINIVSTLRKY